MRYVIVDVEATCWKERSSDRRNEIIEIGSVMLHPETLEIEKEFSSFIKPVLNPILSDFCTQLTGIQQDQVDKTSDFKVVLEDYLSWIGTDQTTICSWGDYDKKQFLLDCELHGILCPEIFLRSHLNLKSTFARLRHIRKCGMTAALQILGMDVVGQHHRGIDDARNIARIARTILPHL